MLKLKSIVNFRPIFFIGCNLIIGVLILALGLFYPEDITLTIFLAYFLLLTLFMVIAIIYKKHKYYITLILSIILLCISAFSVINLKSEYFSEKFEGNLAFTGNVTDVKSFSSNSGVNSYTLVAKGDINGKENKVTFTINTSYDVYVGNKIEFNGYFAKNNYLTDNGFNVYAITNKEYYKAISVSNFKASETTVNITTTLKRKILVGLKEYMPDNYGFSYALLTGDTAYIDSNVLSGFRYSGVAHIFAVSGLHIGFLFVFLTRLLKLLKCKRKPRLLISLIILFLYVVFCGLSPSCLRAFIILAIFSLSDTLSFKGDRLSSLALSLIIVLNINPYYLFEVGFVLSYVTYLALVLLTTPIKEKLVKIMPIKIAEFMSPFISAYLGSLPIVITYFGYASAFATLFNMLIVPVISVVFILNFIAVIAFLITPLLAFVCVLPNIIFSALSWFISSIDYLAFIIQGVVFKWAMVPYYAFLVFSTKEVNLSKNLRKIILNIIIIAFFLCLFVVNVIN